MARRLAVLAVLGGLLLLPATGSANHHACPVVRSSGGSTTVQRYNCANVLVPYPVGGPKSPLPCGANLPPVLPPRSTPDFSTPIPPNFSNGTDLIRLDPLAPYGPDFSTIRPNLGTCPKTGTGTPVGKWTPAEGFSLGFPKLLPPSVSCLPVVGCVTVPAIQPQPVSYWFRYFLGKRLAKSDPGLGHRRVCELVGKRPHRRRICRWVRAG